MVLQVIYNYQEIRKLNSYFTIGTVARLVNQKRLDLLLKIFCEFNKNILILD